MIYIIIAKANLHNCVIYERLVVRTVDYFISPNRSMAEYSSKVSHRSEYIRVFGDPNKVVFVDLPIPNDIPTEPFLVAKNRIKFFPFRYQLLYRRSSSEEANLPSISISNQHIHCESQLIDFVNSIFFITDPRNEAVYERKKVSSEEIFNITAEYTTIYEKKKRAAFTQFATKNGAHFLKAHITRKRMNSGRRVERKIVYIMKPDDRGIIQTFLLHQ